MKKLKNYNQINEGRKNLIPEIWDAYNNTKEGKDLQVLTRIDDKLTSAKKLGLRGNNIPLSRTFIFRSPNGDFCKNHLSDGKYYGSVCNPKIEEVFRELWIYIITLRLDRKIYSQEEIVKAVSDETIFPRGSALNLEQIKDKIDKFLVKPVIFYPGIFLDKRPFSFLKNVKNLGFEMKNNHLQILNFFDNNARRSMAVCLRKLKHYWETWQGSYF